MEMTHADTERLSAFLNVDLDENTEDE